MILSANAILGIFAAVLTGSPSLFMFSDPSPSFTGANPVLQGPG